jgi:competence protein ComEA
MKKTLWNGFAACVAVLALVAAPAAFAAAKKTPTPAADASDAKADKTAKVNLNTADEKDIAATKGVGAKLAKALVAGRPYRTWDDVSKVKGVGSGKKLDSLKTVLKLSEGPAAAAASAEKPAKETKASKTEKAADAAPAAPAAAPASPAAPAPVAGGAAKAKAATSEKSEAPKLAPGTKININTASAEELDKLPEIGPVKAQAIVEYRKANGPFKSAEDIEKVKGIKEGTFAKIKDFIVVK